MRQAVEYRTARHALPYRRLNSALRFLMKREAFFPGGALSPIMSLYLMINI
jgi:hypothetical protein